MNAEYRVPEWLQGSIVLKYFMGQGGLIHDDNSRWLTGEAVHHSPDSGELKIHASMTGATLRNANLFRPQSTQAHAA